MLPSTKYSWAPSLLLVLSPLSEPVLPSSPPSPPQAASTSVLATATTPRRALILLSFMNPPVIKGDAGHADALPEANLAPHNR